MALSGQGGNASGGTSAATLTINSAAPPAVTTSNVNQNLTGTSTVKNVAGRVRARLERSRAGDLPGFNFRRRFRKRLGRHCRHHGP